MSLIQSATAKRRNTPPVPQQAGILAKAIFEHTFTTNYTAATDILELGMLPATARLVGATLIGTALGALTADVGLMDGEAGEYDETRNSGNEIFNDASVNNAETDATLASCLAVTPSDRHRGIGVILSGNVTAGASKKVTLVITYTY